MVEILIYHAPFLQGYNVLLFIASPLLRPLPVAFFRASSADTMVPFSADVSLVCGLPLSFESKFQRIRTELTFWPGSLKDQPSQEDIVICPDCKRLPFRTMFVI